MKKSEEMSFFEAIAEARKAKEAYERLNAIWLEAKKVFDVWNMEEKEKAIPFWRDIYYEVNVYKDYMDMECWDVFSELKSHMINRKQFKEKMKHQTEQIETELKKRKQKYERSRRVASTAYNNWVNSIPRTLKYLKFVLKQSETKMFIIEDLMNMI